MEKYMANSRAINQQEVQSEIVAYLQHINFAKNCCIAYAALYDNIQNNDYILNKAAGFFTITRYALSKCLLIELSKLFCGSGNERTVRKLIRIVRAKQDVFDVSKVLPICDKYDAKLDDYDFLIAKLKARRDQDLTHNDPVFFFGDINPAEKNRISIDECVELIDLVFTLCQELLDFLPPHDPICLDYGADDFNEFIEFIKKSGCFDK